MLVKCTCIINWTLTFYLVLKANWKQVFLIHRICAVFIVCFEGPHCCLFLCFIMSTWNLSFLYDKPKSSKTQRRSISISMFLSLYIKISGFCTILVHYCAISFPFQKLSWLYNLTSLMNQPKHSMYALNFFLNYCPVFSTILCLCLQFLTSCLKFKCTFSSKSGKYSMVLAIKPFFWGP